MVVMTKQVRINEHTNTVGLGDLVVTKDAKASLACFGLGSCICVCAYDPVSRVSGMAHIVLPQSKHGLSDKTATKYADVAIPVLIEKMEQTGASKVNIRVKIAGGARMIKSFEMNDSFDMGNRNLESVNKVLTEQNIRVIARDTGGNQGRSVWMVAETGQVLVRTAGEEMREL
jgi:chemotaxis protein CheD